MKRIFYWVVIWQLLIVGLSRAEAPRFGFREMFRIHKAYEPRLSPDGKFVLFRVAEADTVANRWVYHLWRVETATGETVQLTFGHQSQSHPRWSPDGGMIYYLAKAGGHRNLFALPNDGGESHRVFAHPADITAFQLTRDGEKIYFLARDSLTREEQQARKRKDDAYFYDENQKPVQLWVYDRTTGEKKQLTFAEYSIREFVLSPDESRIALVAAPTPRLDDYLKREVYLFNLQDGTQEQLTHNSIAESQLAWSPDGRYLSFTSDANSQLETYYQDSIFLLDIASGTVVDLLPDFRYQVFRYVWNRKGTEIYFIANMGVNTQIFSLNRKKGGVKQLTSGEHSIRFLHYQPKINQLVYLNSTPRRPYEVFLAHPKKLPGKQLTRLNPWLRDFPLAEYRTIHWQSSDGFTVEGILILPTSGAQKPFPLVVQLHGGPESSYRNYFGSSWVTYPQVWAAHGYAIFQPNYRGSTGYGDEVMRSILGHYFEKDIDDIISGIDYLIREGIADPHHLAVMGWSAGGHLTNWLVTHFQRFGAACSGAGGANWYSFYAQTDVQYIREIWHLGPPYLRQNYYMKKSPVTYVEHARTPTLILCGEEDRRVPFPQSLEMYRGLKRMGCPVRFIAFPREGHGLRELRHQMTKMKREFQWVEKHLFNRDWELSDLR